MVSYWHQNQYWYNRSIHLLPVYSQCWGDGWSEVLGHIYDIMGIFPLSQNLGLNFLFLSATVLQTCKRAKRANVQNVQNVQMCKTCKTCKKCKSAVSWLSCELTLLTAEQLINCWLTAANQLLRESARKRVSENKRFVLIDLSVR